MFKEKLNEIANQELKASAKSINQTQRNVLMNELLDCLLEDLTKGCNCDNGVYTTKNGLVQIGRVDKAIEFSIDNDKIGFVPVKIAISLPNFDNESDIYSRVEDFQMKLQEKAEAEKKKAELKKEKIKADTERRRKNQELKELKERAEK